MFVTSLIFVLVITKGANIEYRFKQTCWRFERATRNRRVGGQGRVCIVSIILGETRILVVTRALHQ